MSTALTLRMAAGSPGTWTTTAMARPTHRHPLGAGFLVLLLLIAVAGRLIYGSARDSVAEAVNNHIQATAALKANQIEHWLDEKEQAIHGDLRAEFARPGLAEILRQWLAGGRRDPALRARLVEELREIAADNRYVGIILRAGQDGSPLLASHDAPDSAVARARAVASSQGLGTVLEDFLLVRSNGEAHLRLIFLNPLHLGKSPQSTLVAEVTLDAGEALLPMIQQAPGWNLSTRTHLLRGDGGQVLLDSLHAPGSGSPPLAAAQAEPARRDPLQAGSGPDNLPVFAYTQPISRTPWTLLVEVSEADAYAKLDTIAALVAAITVLLLLGGGSWLLLRNRIVVARARHEAERHLLTTRINYLAKYANDCIVLCAASGRILEANDRCFTSYGYTPAEFLGLNLADLHAPDLRDAVPGRLRQVEEDRGVIEESEHARKDGSLFAVEMSTSLIGVDGAPCYQAIIRDVSVRKKLQAEREEHLRRLNDLTCRLVAVQEEERRHLSGELHDQVGANLATMNLNLRRIGKLMVHPDPERLEEVLAETGAMLAETIARIRDYCAELRPAILDYSGLIPALEDLVRRFARYSDIAAEFRHDDMAVRLPAQLESTLFRIAQEALTNCAKHSNAATVVVAIARREGRVVMSVADDGDGFDPHALGFGGAGLGLLTMRERAAMAGGEMSMESHPGGGTRIRVVVTV